jgi:hypothetical protein
MTSSRWPSRPRSDEVKTGLRAATGQVASRPERVIRRNNRGRCGADFYGTDGPSMGNSRECPSVTDFLPVALTTNL